MSDETRTYVIENGDGAPRNPNLMSDVKTRDSSEVDQLVLIDAKLDLLLQANGINPASL